MLGKLLCFLGVVVVVLVAVGAIYECTRKKCKKFEIEELEDIVE